MIPRRSKAFIVVLPFSEIADIPGPALASTHDASMTLPATPTAFYSTCILMFERYTERARRVIFFARKEASEFAAGAIQTEHLLLGLLMEDSPMVEGVARDALSIEFIRDDVTKRVTIGEKLPVASDSVPNSTKPRQSAKRKSTSSIYSAP